MYRALNEKSYRLIEMNIRKTLQASAYKHRQFHRPKLSREICFPHTLNYGRLCKQCSTKQATDNFQRRTLLRKIMKTLKRLIFSFTIANLVNKGILYFFYYYRRVTRGRRGRGLSFTFLKIGRKCPDFEKKCPDFGHLWVKFLI